jgi:hypothetical protein
MKTTTPVLSATFPLILAGCLIAPHGDAQTVGNPDFSFPDLHASFLIKNPEPSTQLSWSFSTYSGVARAGGGHDTSIAVADVNYPGQYAFLQRVYGQNSYISQTVNFSAAGIYRISFSDAGRVRAPSGAGGNLNYSVEIRPSAGGPSVLSAMHTTSTGQPFTTKAHQFIIPAPGDYSVSFISISHSGPYNDNSAILDKIIIEFVTLEPRVVRLTNVQVTPAAGGNPPRFTGTVINGPPSGVAKLQASLDLGSLDGWTVIETLQLDASGSATFTNAPDTRPQALSSTQNFFRVVAESSP